MLGAGTHRLAHHVLAIRSLIAPAQCQSACRCTQPSHTPGRRRGCRAQMRRCPRGGAHSSLRTRSISLSRRSQNFLLVVSKDPTHIAELIAQVEDPQSSLPQAARLALSVLVETLRSLEHGIKRLDVEI